MTDSELDQLRREKWHVDDKPVRTLDDARSFIESVGFCLTYPSRPRDPHSLAQSITCARCNLQDRFTRAQHRELVG